MADTQSKIEKRREEARQRKALNHKRENAAVKHSTVVRIKVIAAIVAIVIALGAIIMPSVGVTKRWISAVTINDTKISAAEYSYYYRTAFEDYYNTMVSYLGYAPIDATKSLEKQQFSETQTYADYFHANAVEELKEVVVWYEAAKAEGYTLPAEAQETVDALLAQVEDVANGNNIRIDAYLASMYGTGFNRELFTESAQHELLAEAFKEEKYYSFEYTDEEKAAYYEENANYFMNVDIRIESFGTAEATEESEGITVEQAKEFAEEFAKGIKSEDDFVEAVLARVQQNMEEGATATDDSLAENVNYAGVAGFDSNVADWAFSDTTKVGDVEVIESVDGTNFYVVYMVSTKTKDTRNTVNVRHILVGVTDSTDTAEMADAKAKAEDLLAQWEDGEATAESFGKLAEENSNDNGSVSNGGLYEGVKPGEMVTNFDAWCFEEGRKAGDSGIIESEYGYHVMYFDSENDVEIWERTVEDTMRQNDFDAYEAQISEGVEVKTHWLGLLLRNEPI